LVFLKYKMIKLIIHPGFVKTGTTYFQENITPFIKNTINLGKPYELRNKLQIDFKEFIYSKKKFSDIKIELLANAMISLAREKKIKTFLFSDESFLDYEFYNPKKNFDKIEKLIFSLKKKIKLKILILLTTRKQSNLVISRFAYLFPKFKKKNSKLINYVTKNIKEKSYFFESLKYYSFALYLEKKFNSKVIFLPLEVLETDINKYFKILKKIFKGNLKLKNYSLSKKNVNSKDNVFFLRKENYWSKVYGYFFKIKKIFFKNNTEFIIFRNQLKKFLFKKIRYTPSEFVIQLDKNTEKKIFKYFFEDNKKLYLSKKINYNDMQNAKKFF